MNKEVDKSNMRKVIIDFPEQFEGSLKFSGNIKSGKKIENIIICGVGGSALPANILMCWIDNVNLPVYIHRDYNLPKKANAKSLIICLSYSGNTEETISSLNDAVKKGIEAAGVSSGGKIQEICAKNNIPWIQVPGGIQPRSASGYLFSALVKIFSGFGIIEDKSKELAELAKNLKKENSEQEGKKIAKKMVNKIPIVYSSNSFKCLARIWKIKFNENSKIPAFYNYFPELNHNEMVGLLTQAEKNNNFYILILRDKDEHERNLKRMNFFSEMAESKGIKVEFIEIKGGNKLLKIFSAIMLGDWITYYLALEYKIDPSPVEIVEQFKKRMEE